MSPFLVLWDVDYTLVDTYGVGRHLYEQAFAELYGRELPAEAAEANMAGRTDRAIALDVLTLADVPDPRGQVQLFEAALTRLAPGLATMVAERGRALPGATAAIAALADGAAAQVTGAPVRQSLLTGNVRALAEVKLASLGLTKHLDLEVGAYGNEHEVRAELVPLARRRAAEAYGAGPRAFDGERTILVGDTPLDVEAALATGARAVAVATGRFTIEELARSGAHAVLPDLADTSRAVAAILG